MVSKSIDVLIVGGGLAGLTLAKQLIDKNNQIQIMIIEQHRFPVPKTTAKVGESTVELASHYLLHTLGLSAHFKSHHLSKNGLRCFFGKPKPDFSDQDELGTSALFDLPTFQLERGVLENHLHGVLIDSGVKILDAARVESFELGNQNHISQIQLSNHDIVTIHSKWFIDAAGRRALLKDHFSLHQSVEHVGNAIWFRVDRKIELDEWSQNSDWHDRLHCPGKRWLSTNHLMGPGYWVWIIPLASGATSIGIVMDEPAFNESDIESYSDALVWLRQEQPILAEALKGTNAMDFVTAKDYAYGAKQVISAEGWAMVGEAGLFADPFYSPGSDFIAIGNTLVAELIDDSLQNKNIHLKTLVFERTYQEIFFSTLSLYQGQYGGFGDRQMMAVKLVWDYTYYWGVLALLFFRKALTNIELMRHLSHDLQTVRYLNQTMQAAFRKRAKRRLRFSAQGMFMNQFEIPCLHQVTETLKKPTSDCLKSDLKQNLSLLEQLSPVLLDLLNQDSTSPANTDMSKMEGDEVLIGSYRSHVCPAMPLAVHTTL